MSHHESLIYRFHDVSRSESGWRARCPAHDDESRSLRVTELPDGGVDITCLESCDVSVILGEVGIDRSDLEPQPGPDPTSPTIYEHELPYGVFRTAHDAVKALETKQGPRSATWRYDDVNGRPVGLVVRWDGPEGKEIRPVSRYGDGWKIAAMPVPRPLTT